MLLKTHEQGSHGTMHFHFREVRFNTNNALIQMDGGRVAGHPYSASVFNRHIVILEAVKTQVEVMGVRRAVYLA